jgi:hypothetical protein|tara:strand:+ start:594 stop:1262 length:669 start_codon:yes stop_codon:yes gene_type:complete
MTTSSSRDFDIDVAEIIEEAYERCGLEIRTGYDAKTARRSMNLMFADWANRGLNLWTVTQTTLSMVSGTASYTLTSNYTDLLEVVIRNSSNVDTTLTKMSRSEYLSIPNKTSSGRPTQFFYDRQVTPTITLWPTPNSASDTLVYYYVNRIQDVDTLQNTTDAPFRFLPCMVAGLAYYVAIKKAPERVQMLKSIYEEEFQRAADEDEDRVSLKLQPSVDYMRM